jgi:hypothetical protein
LVKVLQEHFKPPPKALAERYKFTTRKQRSGETAAVFLAELRKLAITCKFVANLSERLRDQFIFGLSNEGAMKRIFTKEDSLTLDDALKVALSQEAAETGVSTVRDSLPSGDVHFTSTRHPYQGPKNPYHGQGQKKQFSGGKSQGRSQPPRNQSNSSCPNCGSMEHKKAKDCPHKDAVCYNCNKKGHFKRFCRSGRNSHSAHAISVGNDYSVSNVNSITQGAGADAEFTITVLINGLPHQMEFDSGCQRSLLSEDFWVKNLGAPALRKSNAVFRTFTDQSFRPWGN